ALSAFAAGFRGGRSPSMPLARSLSVFSFQRLKTVPVRNAPLIAVAGRYGPTGDVAKVGMNRFCDWARSQTGIELACSKGIRRPAKFCANPPQDAKSSLSDLLSCSK